MRNAWVTSSYYRDGIAGVGEESESASSPLKRYAGAKWLPFDAKSDSAKPFCTHDKGRRRSLLRIASKPRPGAMR